MPWIAAAMGVQAIAGIGSTILGNNAAQNAADLSAAASTRAINETRRQYDINQGNLRPWLTTGASALGKLANLYGLDSYTLGQPAGTGTSLSPGQQAAKDSQVLAQIRRGALDWESVLPGNGRGIVQMIDSGASLADIQAAMNRLRATTTNPQNTAFLDPLISQAMSGQATPVGEFVPAGTGATGTPGAAGDMSGFFASPDYNFRLNESLRALEARAATGAFGGLDSGALRKATLARAGDLASSEFNTYVNRLNNLAGIGQTAANTIGGYGENASNNIAGRLQGMGDTQAASIYNQGRSWANTINDIGGMGTGFALNRAYGGGGGGGQFATFNPGTQSYVTGPQGFDPRGFA